MNSRIAKYRKAAHRLYKVADVLSQETQAKSQLEELKNKRKFEEIKSYFKKLAELKKLLRENDPNDMFFGLSNWVHAIYEAFEILVELKKDLFEKETPKEAFKSLLARDNNLQFLETLQADYRNINPNFSNAFKKIIRILEEQNPGIPAIHKLKELQEAPAKAYELLKLIWEINT